jgi:hypothetical protein
MSRQFILAGIIGIAAAAGCRSVDEPKGQGNAHGAGFDAHGFPFASALVAVWGSGPSDVWAVGTLGAIVHFDGRSWSASKSGSTKNLSGVAGTGRDVGRGR